MEVCWRGRQRRQWYWMKAKPEKCLREWLRLVDSSPLSGDLSTRRSPYCVEGIVFGWIEQEQVSARNHHSDDVTRRPKPGIGL